MLNVNVINAKNTQKVEVKPGQPANLKVDPNTRFELVDSASGKAPAQIKARRVGDNLEIVMGEKALIEEEAISNAQTPDLVLENYYKQADVSLYAGAGEEAVSYVPVDGAASSTYAAMGTSATTGAALGVFPLFNPLLGAAAIGAGAIVSANSKSTSNQLPVAQDAAAKATENKVVSEKVPTATDADGTVASYRLVSDVSAGKLTFNTDGSYSFDANKDFDNLAVGQTKTVNFTYSAVDNAGGVSAPKTVTITVTGTNDAPVASAATKSVDEGAKVEGSVTATDADAGATLKYALVGAAPAGLTFKDDGTYSFDASDAGYDRLKAGETQDVLVKFKANDGTVDSAEQTLTIKVKGVNDAATISGKATGAVTEDATSIATGSLTVSDVDAGQAKVVAQKDSAGTYGRFSITEAGAWTYSLDNSNTKVQALNADEKVKETFKVKSADGAASQDVTVTISGSNDAPIATFVTNIEISEDAVGYKVQLTATDVDTAATLKYKLVDPAAFDSIGIALSESGQLTVNTSNSKYQELKKDDLIDLEIKYQVEDDKGSASLESAFRLKISGVNDTATITGVSTGFVSEDAADSTAKGDLKISDADAGQSKAIARSDVAGTYGKFSITEAGGWIYTLDNGNANVQALVADGKVTETFTVKSADNTAGQDVVVTIKGVNDAPVASAATKSVDEGAKVEGSVTATDADAGTTLTYALVGAAPAGLSFKNDGTYSFDASNVAYNSLKAGETQDVLVKFKANDGTVDSAEQTLTVTVKGTNDVPTISLKDGDADIGAKNATDTTEIAGSLTLSDVDTDGWTTHGVGVKISKSSTFDYSNQLSAEEQSLLTTKLLDMFTLNAVENAQLNKNNNQQWSFKMKNAAEFKFLSESETLVIEYWVTVGDAHGASAEHPVTITITGVNDAPAIQVQPGDKDRADLTETNTALTAKGTISLFDMDLTDEMKYEVSDVALKNDSTFLSADEFKIIKDQVKGFMKLDAIGRLNKVHNLEWTFDSTGDSNVGFIPKDKTLSLDYTLTATDKSGVTATHVIHIHILGTNATPRIEFKEGDSKQELLTETDDVLKTTGTMSLTDRDLNDPASASRISVNVTGFTGVFDNSHFLGMLKLSTENNQNGEPLRVNEPHNVRWTFDSLSKDAFDYLAKDEVLKLDYTIQVKDSLGATSSEIVAVEIKGTNDAPLIYTNIETAIGTDSAEGKVDSSFKASGTLTVIDEDLLTALVTDVKLFKGADSTAKEIDVQGLNLEEMLQISGTFEDTNEMHNLTWKFVGEPEKAEGLESGAYTLAYNITITDAELFSQQTVNIHFVV